MAEYIEREAAVESFMGEFPDAHYPSWYAEKLKEIPAADVAEVRHGEWVEQKWTDTHQHICSLCSATVRVHPQSVEYKYCPYCGAKMDGKGEDHETL